MNSTIFISKILNNFYENVEKAGRNRFLKLATASLDFFI